MSFRILVVCTANICRSPIAERLLRMRLASEPSIVVVSAGTAGLDGHEMDGASAHALRELGGDPSGHVARSVTTAEIAAADLVLTATSGHRATILQADPLAFRRTFTLREFGRLGAQLDPPSVATTLPGRVKDIAQGRGMVGPPAAGEDEIGDPFGAPWPVVQASARQISDAVDAAVSALGLSRSVSESAR